MTDIDADPFGTTLPAEDGFDEEDGFPAGRDAVAEAFLDFAADPSGPGTFYLTGGPGTGRSTTLTWLFLLQSEQDDDSEPLFHAALGARGRGADDLAAAIGEQLGYGVATADELLSVLAVDHRPVTIAIGDLDQAGPVPSEANTARIVERLLAPMDRLPHVRLVTEGAPAWAAQLGSCKVVDLDDPQWTDRAAFDRYVRALCEYGAISDPHFADSVSRAAYPGFLLAQVLVLAHVSAPTAGPLPGGLADAVARHLGDLAADALYALALAGEDGFDSALWQSATGVVAGHPMDATELDRIAERSAALLTVRPDEPGTERRYRLRHPAIGQALLATRDLDAERRARGDLARAMADRIPTRSGADGASRPDWAAADPLWRSALIRQAAAAGILGPLLRFPDLLLHMDLDRLRAAVESVDEPAAVALRPALTLLHPSAGDQAARLQAAAVQHGLAELAAAVESLYPRLPFRVTELRPEADSAEVAHGARESVFTEAGVLEVARHTEQGRVLRWSLRGTPCTAVAEAVLDELPVVLVADREGSLHVRALEDGSLVRPTVRTDEPAELLHLLGQGPDPLCVCAAGDRRWVARVFDGATLTELRFGADIRAITSPAAGELDVEYGKAGVRLVFDLDHVMQTPALRSRPGR